MRPTCYPTVSIPLVLAVLATTAIAAGAPSTQPALPTAERFAATDEPLRLDGAAGDLAAWLKTFDRTPERFEYAIRPARVEFETCRVFVVTFPSPVRSPWPENDTVTAELYLPAAPQGRIPAAIVLDIMDGSALVPRAFAKGMADQGLAALYVPMACYGPRRPAGGAHFDAMRRDPTRAVENLRQTVMDVRRAKALLASRPEVDPARIGLTGVSLGGIVTSLAAGVDGTFFRVVPIMAGGDLAAITFHARETRAMRAVLKEHGMDEAATARMLAPVEPTHFARRIAPQTCLMINAARDEVIPRATTEALHKAIGPCAIEWLPMSHYSAIWFLPDIRQRAIDFLKGGVGERIEDRR